MAHTIVIADDVTGANDIGIMYAKAGLETLVYSYEPRKNQTYRECDVLILDTDSRFDTRKHAYRKVFDALKGAPKEGVKQYINKQCSVFRGNIGAEFDAMLDALQETFAVVVLGFPNNGRTTVHSRHYVFGTLLEESQFRSDPVHPMQCSDLREILRKQSGRPVGAVHYEVYEKGTQAVKDALEQARARGGYCIMDVRDNQDLEFLADILKEERIICGSSALSEYLAKVQNFSGWASGWQEQEVSGEKVLCMAGSLTPQTINQTAYMRNEGYPVFELDTRKLLDKEGLAEESRRLQKAAVHAYESGTFVMVHSMQAVDLVAETKCLAAERGIDNKQVSTLVSGVLSEIAAAVTKECGVRKMIVCGGDTSASLCARLGIRGMRVLKEIETGLPTCESVEAPYYQMVLKSGSFGSTEFILKAVRAFTSEGDMKHHASGGRNK